MRKTSVYLTDEDAERLSRVAARTGRPQSQLIRDGIRHVIGTPETRRKFRSLGTGHGGGKPFASWRSRDLMRKVMGR